MMGMASGRQRPHLLIMGYYYNLARGTMEIIRLRDALSCLRDAVDRRLRRPEGRTMQPEGG